MCGGGWVGKLPAGGGGEAGASTPARVPARGGRMHMNKRSWQLPWVLGKVPSRLRGGESGRADMLAVTVTMAVVGAACARGGAQEALL
jgi:hypothetical protein